MFLKRLKIFTSAVVLAGGFGINTASAATCAPNAVMITDIGGAELSAGIAASACMGTIGGNLSGGALVTGLNDGTYFSSLSTLSWFDLGKDDSATNDDTGQPVVADVDATVGDWTANFSAPVETFVLLLKAGNEFSLFLFDGLTSGDTLFDGTFDTGLAGFLNKKGKPHALSHLEVAGVYVGTPAPIPLPAAGFLLFGALGGLGLLRRRRKVS